MKLILILLASIGAARAFEDETVAGYLSDNGYTKLTKYLHDTGLYTTLAGPGQFTVFAPTDAAFRQLDAATKSRLSGDSAELLEVIEYHVTSEPILADVVLGRTQYKTLLGGALLTLHKIVGGAIMVNNGTHLESPRDVICGNGVVQTIGEVLFPPTKPTNLNIDQIFKSKDKFRAFKSFLISYQVFSMLESADGDFTVFAPNNDAVGLLSGAFTNPNLPTPTDEQLADVCKYHIIPEAITLSQLRNRQSLVTVQGLAMNITVASSGDVMVDYAHVIEADIPAANGIIHVIDQLLVPKPIVDAINRLSGHDETYTYPILH